MKRITFYIFITLLLAVGATAQVKTDVSKNKKFADALEAQVSCGQKLEPAKAIRVLQKAGIISKSQYIVFDSINYFKVKRPLTIFGFKVESVFGFDEDEIFVRGPGTSPGIQLGIIVPYSVEEVKAKLKNLDSQKIAVEEALDYIKTPSKPRIRTEITCKRRVVDFMRREDNDTPNKAFQLTAR